MTRLSQEPVEQYRFLASPLGLRLLEELSEDGGRASSAQSRRLEAVLRDMASELDPVALRLRIHDVLRARSKAAAKFGEAGAHSFLGDVAGVEQASGPRVAGYKAWRMSQLGVTAVVDLCCGVGGDARAFVARFGADKVVAVDRDPAMSFVTEQASGCRVMVSDLDAANAAEAVAVLRNEVAASPTCVGVHIDPARRSGRQRRGAAIADLEPCLEDCVDFALLGDVGAIKLAPGVDVRQLESALRAMDRIASYEVEWIAETEGLVQAVLWIEPRREATDFRGARATRMLSRVDEPESDRPRFASLTSTFARDLQHDASGSWASGSLDSMVGRLLVQPDPVLERADLFDTWLREHGYEVMAIHPGLGLYSMASDRRFESSGFEVFVARILAALPWRPKKLRDYLASVDAHVTTYRTRGGAIDRAEAERAIGKAALHSRSNRVVDVWGLRLGDRLVALVTESRVRSWPPSLESP